MLLVWMVLVIAARCRTWEIVETDSGIFVQDSSAGDPANNRKYAHPQVEKYKSQRDKIPSLHAQVGNEIILDEEGMVIYDFSSDDADATSDFPAEEYTQFLKDAMQSLKKIECSNSWLFEPDYDQGSMSKKEDSIEDYRKFIREAADSLKEIEYSYRKIIKPAQSSNQEYNKRTVYRKPAKSHNEIMEDYEMFISNVWRSLKKIERTYRWLLEPGSTNQKPPESATQWISLKTGLELVEVLFIILIIIFVVCLFNRIRLIDCMVREYKTRLDFLEKALLKTQNEVRHGRTPIHQRPDTGDDASL